MIVKRKGYKEEYLGREAVFLVPLSKLKMIVDYNGQRIFVLKLVTNFLDQNYGGGWHESPPVKGRYRGLPDGRYRKFQISFIGKHRIPKLKRFLGSLARKIGEESIYTGTGEDFWAIYPP